MAERSELIAAYRRSVDAYDQAYAARSALNKSKPDAAALAEANAAVTKAADNVTAAREALARCRW
jgi:hypothetical protein